MRQESLIRFTRHAKEKFKILRRHKFAVSRFQVIKTVKQPEKLDHSRSPLIIAQRKIDREHVLRVIYKHDQGNIVIITFYPGRIEQYEK